MTGTKFTAPDFGVDLIDRLSALDLLDSGRRASLVLVHSPAGYGKTTLLAQWRRRLERDGVRVIWLSLDEDDHHAAQFVESISAASGVSISASEVASGSSTDMSSRAMAAMLLERLARDGRRHWIVLDDYHRAQSAATDEILAFMIGRLPANVSVAVASRTIPTVPLAALKARGQLCEINAADLSFSLDETRLLFAGRLNDVDLVALHNRLEGWPVALQLALIWLSHESGVGGVEPLLRLSRDDLADFLTTEVLAGLSPQAQQILMVTAIMEEFNADLTRALCDVSDVAAAFEELNKLGGLVVALRRPGRWYRCHHLLRDFLYDRLTLRGEEEIRNLHRRAAEWFHNLGELMSAVRHAVRAREFDEAAQWIEAAGAVRIGLISGLLTLSRLMDMLPLETVYNFPRLQVARAWMLSKGGLLVEGRECYENVRDAVESLPEGDPARHEGLFVDMMLSAVYEDDARALSSTAEIERIACAVPKIDHWFQGWINNLLAIIHTRRGALANAREAAMSAKSHYRMAGALYGQIFMQIHLAIVATLSGRLSEANETIGEALESASREFPADLALRGIPGVVMAQVFYERNRLEEAQSLLEEALPNIQHAEGWVEIYVRGFQTRAAIAYAQEGLDAALVHLDDARQIGEVRRLPRLIWLADCRKTELLTLAGKVTEAAAYAEQSNAFLERHMPAFISWRERKRAMIAKARLAICQGEASTVRKALQNFRRETVRYGRDRALMEISIMEGLAAHADKDQDEARAALKRAFAIAVPERFLRPFIDEGVLMGQLLRLTVRQIGVAAMPAAMVTFIAEVLAVLGDLAAEDRPDASAILSGREVEVLRWVAEGKANKVIARAMDLTEATVKFHLSNIYEKLGVSSRVLAVAVAREKQILEDAGQ